MDYGLRIKYACENVIGTSVVTFAFDDWAGAVRSDGELTVLDQIPGPLSSITHNATVVAAVASGICVTSPGIDIVRLDPKDAPYIYNIDNYSVIENLPQHPCYGEILDTAKVSDSEGLQFELKNNVYIVKNGPTDQHWTDSIPSYIQQAKGMIDK